MSNEGKHIEVWAACLRRIQEVVAPGETSTWFVPLKPVSLVESTLTLEVPSDFVRNYIEEHYLSVLKAAISTELGSDAKLKYLIRPVMNGQGMTVTSQESGIVNANTKITVSTIPSGQETVNPFYNPTFKTFRPDSRLNSNYRFSNFVVGDCNKIGFRAGENVAINPGNTPFNPLFIFGGSGLGKTHLSQAIGNAVKEKHPNLIVLYMSGNEFKTQYMDATNARNNLTNFLAYYMKIDVLIVDDIQELQNAKGSQNAFFNVFNHLQQNGKQLIFTSDRAPVELQDFEERLLSRFKWGLQVELTRPDFETRLAVLRAKREKEGVDMSDEVLEYIATHVKNNFRELEGAFVSLTARAAFLHKDCDVELAKQVIGSLVDENVSDLSITTISEAVCNYFGLKKDDLCSKSRKRNIVQARQIAMFLSRKLISGISLSVIGREIGDKDHATVLHSCTTVSNQMDTDATFRQYVSDIEKILAI